MYFIYFEIKTFASNLNLITIQQWFCQKSKQYLNYLNENKNLFDFVLAKHFIIIPKQKNNNSKLPIMSF